MLRARHGPFARLGPVLLAPLTALLAVGFAEASSPAPLAVWSLSTELLVGEVVTGGVSASDEFVEIYNAGTATASLASLEIVYVTASGGTVTRKGSWGDGAVLGPHRHLLLANAAGTYAAGADLTYSGGLSASGGVMVLRSIGGPPLDAIGWGDAANSYVEGAAAPAPPTGSSVERAPGGETGNWVDTNDNAADTIIQPVPIAQDLLAPPAPSDAPALPSETAAASSLSSETVAPTASAASATETPEVTPVSAPTPTPGGTSTLAPTPTPAPTPTSAATATPAASATPFHVAIAVARSQAVGSLVAVDGIVTAELGRMIDARTFVIQDDTAGIAVRLPLGSSSAIPAGERVAVRGRLAHPYGNQLVDVARQEDVILSGQGALPQPLAVGHLDESVEGLLVRVEGRVTSVDRNAATTVSAFLMGAASIRIVALRVSGVPLVELTAGQMVTATGIVAQRVTRTDPGYRVWLRAAGDLQARPAPTPTATATARPTASPTSRPSSPPAASVSPDSVSISQARARIGQRVLVEGVTTVRAGLLDADARRVTIEDRSGGILVRVPTTGPRPRPGDRLRVSGMVGTYYGAPQLAATTLVITAHGVRLFPAVVNVAPIPERLEWRLVRLRGTIRSVRRDGKAWRVELGLSKGAIPIHGEARAAIASTRLQAGGRLTVTGIVRRPRSNASDRRFEVIPRDTSDLVLARAAITGSGSTAAESGGGPSGAGTGAVGGGSAGSGAGGSGVRDIELASLGRYEGRLVRVGGVLVAQAGFRLTLRDATGTAVVRLPASAAVLLSELVLGEPLNAIGRVTRVGRMTWEVVSESPGDLARVGRLGPGAAAIAEAPSLAPDGSSAGTAAVSAADRSFSAGRIGTAGLLPPALLFLGLGSAALWAVGLYLRRRRPAGGREQG